jgi:hypothetical protein
VPTLVHSEFEPDVFPDDQTGHAESAAGHVAAGVANPVP